MKLRGFILIMLSFLLISCEKVEQIPLEELPIYGVGPNSHTFYTGSDKKFHYFTWKLGEDTGTYKVSGAELKLDNPFPKGSDRAFIYKTAEGKIGVGMSPYNPHVKSEPLQE